jgi:hypothetical protein
LMSFGGAQDRQGPLVDRLNAAIRDNPLAASFIGAGLAWMLFGGAKGFSKAAGLAATVGGAAKSTASDLGDALAGGVTKAGTTVGAAVRRNASGALDAATSVVSDVSPPAPLKTIQAVSQPPSAADDGLAATAAGRHYGPVIPSKLSEHLERQPLLLGVIGLGIGAGIASAFATTEAEGELMGHHGSAARKKMQDLTDDVKDRATQLISEVKDEAERQGLTTAAATTAVKEVAEKAKAVAAAGRDAIKDGISN